MEDSPRPYRPMATTCSTRALRPTRLYWPDLPPLPEVFAGASWDFISGGEAPVLAETWRRGYPELMGSNLDFIFHPEMYPGRVLLKENLKAERHQRDYCMLRWMRDDRVVGAMLLTKWDANRHVELTIGTVLPERRGSEAIFVHGFPLVEQWLRASGAEYLTAFCETWHDLSQRLVEANGFRICGIFPGHLTRWATGDRQYRGCTVHYYKFINHGDELATRPEEWSLSQRAADLWSYLEWLNKGM